MSIISILIFTNTFNHRVRGHVEHLRTLVQRLRMKIRKKMMMEGRRRLPLPHLVTQLPQEFRQLLCRHQSFARRVRIICYSCTFRSHVYLHTHKRFSANIADCLPSLNGSAVKQTSTRTSNRTNCFYMRWRGSAGGKYMHPVRVFSTYRYGWNIPIFQLLKYLYYHTPPKNWFETSSATLQLFVVRGCSASKLMHVVSCKL